MSCRVGASCQASVLDKVVGCSYPMKTRTNMSKELTNFYRERYNYEVSRRNELGSAVSIPIGVLSLVFTAVIASAKDLHPPFDFLKYFQLLAIIVCAITCLVSAYFLIHSYFNYEYQYIASPKDVQGHYEKLISHYRQTGMPETDASVTAESETLKYVSDRYTACAHTNTGLNDSRSTYLHKAKAAMIVASILAVLVAIPYIVRTMLDSNPVSKIEIVNLKELHSMSQNFEQQHTNSQTPAPKPPPPQPAEKPAPPPDRFIKESDVPKKRSSQP
jgi:hypothetical protein